MNDILDTYIGQVKKYNNNQVVRNSMYGVIQFVLPTLLLLGFTPIFIRTMGTESYGLWMVATSALGLMGIAEFGINTAISKYIAEYAGSSNTNALSGIVTVGFVTQFIVGFGLLGPLFVYSPALAGILKSTEASSIEEIRRVIQIMSLGFIPLLLRSGALAIPIGLQRFKTPLLVNVGYQALNYTFALIVVLLGGSVAQVVSCSVIVLWVAALVSMYLAWRMLKPFNLKFTFINSKEVTRKMFSFAFMSGISSLGSQIFSYADRLAVGAVLGLEAVAYYSILISVVTKISQLSGSLMGALMPAVSAWMVSGEIKRVRSYFLKAMVFLIVLNFLIASVLLSISEKLLRVWIGESFADHTLASFRVLIVIYSLFSLNSPAYFVAYGMGKPGINALMGIVGGYLTIVLIFSLGKIYGLLGAAYANAGYLLTLVIIGYVYWKIERMTNNPSPVPHCSESNS